MDNFVSNIDSNSPDVNRETLKLLLSKASREKKKI